jgi:hypothetical protein
MSKIKQVDIPSPCSANWQDMTPQNGGRHCYSCSKTVIDFTAMPDSKIIAYLSQHKNICGQFYSHQLKSLNQNLAYDKRIHPKWRRLMAAACIAGLLSVVKAEAKPVTPTEQVSPPKIDERKPVGDSTMVLKGKVIDKTSGLPLKNATIFVNSTNITTQTDEMGEFVFMVPVNTSYLGVTTDNPGPITTTFTSTNQKYQGISVPVLSYRIVTNIYKPSDNRVIRGEIRTKPGQKFNKENLIKIRSAKEIGRLGDFDEEKVKRQ